MTQTSLLSTMHKVTVVTPLYNGESFVGETIESVLGQTHSQVEHIVVDDGSTDRSAEVVETLARTHPTLQLIRQENRGVAAARNRGARAAPPESEYLLFLDADDLLVPEMLSRLAGYLTSHPRASVVCCASAKIDASGRPLGNTARHVESDRSAMRLAPSRFGTKLLPDTEPCTPLTSILTGYHGFIPSCALIRRSVFDATPGFDEDFGQPWEDNDLFVHLALRGEVHYLPERLVSYRQHNRQSTADTPRNQHQEYKFRQKWGAPDAMPLSPDQRRSLTDALHFWEYRAKPIAGFETAFRLFGEGDFRGALQFFGGALSRYPRSLFRRYGTSFAPASSTR